MESLFHNTGLSISQTIQGGFVYWWADYGSAGAQPWVARLGAVALPVVCNIDPNGSAGSSRGMTTGLLPSGTVRANLLSSSAQLPLVITNMPGEVGSNALHNGLMTIGGWARTNSPMVGSITGSDIANVMWRGRDDSSAGGDFAPVARLTRMSDALKSWSTDFVPNNGTNAFETYVVYANGKNSWTNVVRFVYLGGPVQVALTVSLSPATNSVAPGSNVTFTAQINGGTPPYNNVTLQFGASDFSSGIPPTYTNLVVMPINMSDPATVPITVSNVDVSYRGYYRVIASDSNTSATSSPVSLNVIPAGRTSQDINFTSLPPKTYGDAPFALTATASSGLTVSYSSSNTNVARISGSTLTIVGAGTAVITASQLGNGTYAAATPVSQTQTVNQAELSVAAADQPRRYGATNPVLTVTITGFVNGDTRASAVTGSPAISTTAVTNSVVGTYPITVAQGSLAAVNYSFISFTDGTLTVTPATLTVTADNQFKMPGAANPPLTYTITGLVNGDTQDSAVTGTPDLSTTATTASGSGTYPITVTQGSLAAANYSFSFINGTLSVGDNLPPTLTVTSYSNFQFVAATSITLAGTASDAGQGDDGIRSVTVNGLAATNGTASGSNVANWSRTESLAAGTNTFRVVASDNASPPNLVTNLIRIISDTVPPTIHITAPTANQRWSNNVFTVQGTATDNLRLAGVWCVANGVWGSASIGNSGTNWTFNMALASGSNTVRAYSVDAAGNKSPTNSVTFVYVASDRLTLITSGNGTVSPNYGNAVLQVGQSYTITATPGTGYLFSNWVGSVTGNVVISSNAASLHFLMQSNLVLQANFVPNPFISLQGVYSGLFYPTDKSYMSTNAGPTNSGFVGLTLNNRGGYSGSLLFGGQVWSFTGAFDVGLQSRATAARKGSTALGPSLSLRLNPAIYYPQADETETNVLTGTIAQGSQWLSDLRAYRNSTGNSNLYAGAYTLLIEGCNDWGTCFGDGFTTLPDGDSPATVTILPTGAIQVRNGTLADGTAFATNAMASEQGVLPLYVPLYGGQGFLMGWVTLTTNQSGSPVEWLMPPRLSGHYNTNGFSQSRLLLLTKYAAPAPGQNAMNWSNAVVQITGGNLPIPANSTDILTSQVLVSNNVVRVISGTISNLTITITATNGLFKGSFRNPVSNTITSFNGALATDPGTPIDGGGWWLGPRGEGGNIRIKGAISGVTGTR